MGKQKIKPAKVQTSPAELRKAQGLLLAKGAQLVQIQRKRIDALEKENAELKAKLAMWEEPVLPAKPEENSEKVQ